MFSVIPAFRDGIFSLFGGFELGVKAVKKKGVYVS